MSYVPPHARSSVKGNQAKLMKPKPVLKNNYVNEFPELGNAKPIITTNMNFKQLFDDENYEITVKPKEIQKGMIILTQNGIINSLTIEEQEEEQTTLNNKIMHKNMIDMFHHIEQQRNNRLIRDSNYIPEEVVPEYSSSEASLTTDESETDAEDPEDDNEF
jgi:hypothetical protein